MKERDQLGRLIDFKSCLPSNPKSGKNSPRKALPTVFQFNKKWTNKKAAGESVKGDWESREIPYASDHTLQISQKVDIPLVNQNLAGF